MHRRLLLLLLGWRQLEVLAKLAKVVHVTPHNDLALGLWRRRLLHLLLLLLLGRLVDVWRRQSNVVRRHDDLLGLKLLLLLLLLIVGHHRRRWHVSRVVRMSHVHRRFAHGLHLAAGATTLLWSQRWRRFGVVWRRARILPHGTLRQWLSVTIYIHATAVATAVGHFPVAVHLVHARVTIYNRRLAMLLLLLMGLMLNVAAVRRLVRVHRVLRRASAVLLIARWNLLLLLRGHRHVLIAVVLVGWSLWAQRLLLLLWLLLRRQRLLWLRLHLLWWLCHLLHLLNLLNLLLLWWSSSVVGQRRWRASGGQLTRVTLALGRYDVLGCVRWHHPTLIVHTIRVRPGRRLGTRARPTPRSHHRCERVLLVAVLQIDPVLVHRIVLDFVRDPLRLRLLVLKVVRVLLRNLHRVPGQRLIKRRLHSVDRLVLVEHIIHVPPVRIRVQLQRKLAQPAVTVQPTEATATAFVPRLEFALLRSAVSVAPGRTDGRVRLEGVPRRVIQVHVLRGNTDNVARLEDEPVHDGVDDDLVFRFRAAVLNAMGHFQHDLKLGRECPEHSLEYDTGCCLDLDDVADV